jgi:hypothetical protein
VPNARRDPGVADTGQQLVYHDEPLDQAHDEQGFSHDPDNSGPRERLNAVPPTLVLRLRWRLRGLVYLGAFLLPLLILLLPLAVIAALNGDDDSPVAPDTAAINPQWPAEVEFVAHTVPAMIKNDLPLAGMKQGYRFRGQAGQVWLIIVEPQEGSTLDPQITLYSPSGEVLAQNDARSPGESAAALTIPLPQRGDYRLVVESAQNGLTTGAYLMTLFEE